MRLNAYLSSIDLIVKPAVIAIHVLEVLADLTIIIGSFV